MNRFKIRKVVKVGTGLPILRAEYISAKEGFMVKEYQQALENYYTNVDEMRVLPIDDFYRIGVEHFHKLDKKHKKMLIKLKQNCDNLEIKWLPLQIKSAASMMGQFFGELERVEKQNKNSKN